MTDVMWARPDGTKILLADSPEAARFVGGVYAFDEIRVTPMTVLSSGDDGVEIKAGELELNLVGGPPLRLFALRPRWLRRSPAWVRFEDVVLRRLVGRFVLQGAEGVRAYGVSPSGVKEWYCVDGYRRVVSGHAKLNGVDLGSLGPLEPRVDFGFSEFPRVPALVRCAPLLEGAERFLPEASARAAAERA